MKGVPYIRDINDIDFSSGWPNERLVATGYLDELLFKSEKEVISFFTVQNMSDIYSEHDYVQTELKAMAAHVIRHCINKNAR
jgi:hypothetical protein